MLEGCENQWRIREQGSFNSVIFLMKPYDVMPLIKQTFYTQTRSVDIKKYTYTC